MFLSRPATGKKARVAALRDVAARIAELIDLFDAADSILARTLDEPLSRAALGIEAVS